MLKARINFQAGWGASLVHPVWTIKQSDT